MVKRETAYMVNISDIHRAPYIRTNEEYEPNYMEINGKNVSRVNIIATVVSNEGNGNISRLIVDDGTSSIRLMSFENTEMFSGYDVGDIILIIGRVREYNSEKYIVPEILKKITNPKWVELRKMILKPSEKVEEVKIDKVVENVVEEDIIEDIIEDVPQAKIIEAVKELDKGDGADIDEVIKIVEIEGAEKLIESMLREGDIFQIKPGRIKIL